ARDARHRERARDGDRLRLHEPALRAEPAGDEPLRCAVGDGMSLAKRTTSRERRKVRTMRTEKQHGKAKGQRAAETECVGSPISNDAYNVIAALHAKLEGLEAYRKYAKDGNGAVWKELTQADVECVSTLV